MATSTPSGVPVGTPVAAVRDLSVCISVSDLDRSVDWYGRNLGFRCVLRQDLPRFGARIAYLDSPGGRIELLQPGQLVRARRPDPPEHGGMQGPTQLSVTVDDLAAAAERVRERSLTVAMPPLDAPALGVRVMFIRDEDDNLIELVERLDALGGR